MPRFIILFLAIVFSSVAAMAGQAQSDNIAGVWRHHTLFYEFGPSGTMRIIQADSVAKARCAVFAYEQIPGESRFLIRYGNTLADTAASSYLLIRETGDSLCTIASGTPFVRESGGPGIKGVWKNANKLTIMTWTFTDQSVAFDQQTLDIKNGEFITNERHDGVFSRGKRDEAGLFYIQFSDGTTAEIFPLIAGDVIYLFDLSANRSLFARELIAPVCTNEPVLPQPDRAKGTPAKAAAKR
jgi:hypothetical protein